MMPKKEFNIYPKNEVNIKSILQYYFANLELNTDQVLEYLMIEKTSLELNQIEFLCRKIKESYLTVFRPNLNGKLDLKNLLAYAVEALTTDEPNWNGSQNRIRITGEFRDFVKMTEIDIDYLERNN